MGNDELAGASSILISAHGARRLGGLWRTQDAGATWTSLTDGLPMLAVTDIAVDPLEPATLYLLTGDREGRRDQPWSPV